MLGEVLKKMFQEKTAQELILEADYTRKLSQRKKKKDSQKARRKRKVVLSDGIVQQKESLLSSSKKLITDEAILTCRSDDSFCLFNDNLTDIQGKHSLHGLADSEDGSLRGHLRDFFGDNDSEGR